MSMNGDDPRIIAPSSGAPADLAADAKASPRDKGRHFERMLPKERVMAMFGLLYDERRQNDRDRLIKILMDYNPDEGLHPDQVASLQTIGFLYDQADLEIFLGQVHRYSFDKISNDFELAKGLMIAVIQNAYFEMNFYQEMRAIQGKNSPADFEAFDATLQVCIRHALGLPADKTPSLDEFQLFINRMQEDPKLCVTVQETIQSDWYTAEAGKNQNRKAQEKSMNVRMHYFIHQGLDVPESLKKDFVRYIQRINPHTNIKAVKDIDWKKAKREKKITAPIVSIREQEASEDNVQTTQIRASDIGITQEQVLRIIQSNQKSISLPGDKHNPCNGKPNPLYNRRITSKDGETYLIDAEPGEDGQLHFKKHLITVENGIETIHEEFLDLTVSDVEIKVNYFGKPQTLKEALADSFNHYAYFEPGPAPEQDFEKAQEIDIPIIDPTPKKTVIIPEPTGQRGTDFPLQQPQEGELGMINQQFLEDAPSEDKIETFTQIINPIPQTLHEHRAGPIPHGTVPPPPPAPTEGPFTAEEKDVSPIYGTSTIDITPPAPQTPHEHGPVPGGTVPSPPPDPTEGPFTAEEKNVSPIYGASTIDITPPAPQTPHEHGPVPGGTVPSPPPGPTEGPFTAEEKDVSPIYGTSTIDITPPTPQTPHEHGPVPGGTVPPPPPDPTEGPFTAEEKDVSPIIYGEYGRPPPEPFSDLMLHGGGFQALMQAELNYITPDRHGVHADKKNGELIDFRNKAAGAGEDTTIIDKALNAAIDLPKTTLNDADAIKAFRAQDPSHQNPAFYMRFLMLQHQLKDEPHLMAVKNGDSYDYYYANDTECIIQHAAGNIPEKKHIFKKGESVNNTDTMAEKDRVYIPVDPKTNKPINAIPIHRTVDQIEDITNGPLQTDAIIQHQKQLDFLIEFSEEVQKNFDAKHVVLPEHGDPTKMPEYIESLMAVYQAYENSDHECKAYMPKLKTVIEGMVQDVVNKMDPHAPSVIEMVQHSKAILGFTPVPPKEEYVSAAQNTLNLGLIAMKAQQARRAEREAKALEAAEKTNTSGNSSSNSAASSPGGKEKIDQLKNDLTARTTQSAAQSSNPINSPANETDLKANTNKPP